MNDSTAGGISISERGVTAQTGPDYRRAGYWDRPSVGEHVVHHAAERPTAVALADPDAEATWQQLNDLVVDGVRLLWSAGVRAGDIVVVRGGNSVDLAAIMLAVQAAGAVLCPIQDRSTTSEAAYIVQQAGATLCLQVSAGHSAAELDQFRLLPAECDGTSCFGVVPPIDWSNRPRLIVDWIGAPPQQSSAEPPPAWFATGSAPCRLLYTSGSTGDPKGVLHTNDTSVFAYENSTTLHDWTADSAGWIVLPVTLNWGMFQLYSVLLSGATGVLRRRLDATELLDEMMAGRVTHIGLPPTGLIKLLDATAGSPRFGTGRLRSIVSAGAPCGPRLLDDIANVFGVGVCEAYGMTEVGWIASCRADDAGDGTVGRPARGIEIRVTRPDGKRCGTGEAGAVEVRGPTVFAGYYRNEAQTRAAFTADGWFRTGDQGFLRPDGRLVLSGRDKDVIKHAGHLVSPREIEELLMTSPAIREAAVIGVSDTYHGERIVAVVEATDGAPVELDDVLDTVRGRLSKHKWPQEVVTVAELPRTATGKIQKHVLVNQAKENRWSNLV